MLDKQLLLERQQSFAFAMSLAQNESLHHAIEEDDAQNANEILKSYMDSLKSFSGESLHAQIITKDLTIFARSWDSSEIGLPIKNFRPDLEEVAKTKKPKLSIEAARRLVLIATIPMIHDKEIVGYMEIIRRFDTTQRYFKNFDITFLMLLKETYEEQSILLYNHPRINNMILASTSITNQHLNYLRREGLERLQRNGIDQESQDIYFSKPILNSRGDELGLFVITLSKQKLKLFSGFEKEIANIFTYAGKDVYYSLLEEDPYNKIYDNLSHEDLLELTLSAHPKDKDALEARLREKLQYYSKE